MKNPRVSKRKEILKIKAEINAKETKETAVKINKAKSWLFERINKTDKPLARLIKKQRRKIKSIKLDMKMERSRQHRNTKDNKRLQFSSVAQSCPTLCDPINRSTTTIPVHHQLPEFTQIHVHRVSDAIQPSHPLCVYIYIYNYIGWW